MSHLKADLKHVNSAHLYRVLQSIADIYMQSNSVLLVLKLNNNQLILFLFVNSNLQMQMKISVMLCKYLGTDTVVLSLISMTEAPGIRQSVQIISFETVQKSIHYWVWILHNMTKCRKYQSTNKSVYVKLLTFKSSITILISWAM